MFWAYYMKLYKGTASEACLEPAIAALGVPYRWQHPIGKYFADFTWPVEKIVVEVDGDSHDKPEQIAKDAERAAAMAKQGWVTVRCRNEEAQSDPTGCIRRLRQLGLELASARDSAPQAAPAPRPKARRNARPKR